MEFITENAGQTKEVGRKIATDLVVSDQPLILALTGDLGCGKTTFTQGFAQGLGIKERLISPTFILMRSYGVPINQPARTVGHLYHIDLYRLEENVESQVKNLGMTDIWKESGNITIIEWAEKIKDLLPKGTVWIKFANLGEEKRKISINKI